MFLETFFMRSPRYISLYTTISIVCGGNLEGRVSRLVAETSAPRELRVPRRQAEHGRRQRSLQRPGFLLIVYSAHWEMKGKMNILKIEKV